MKIEEIINRLKDLENPYAYDPHFDDDETGLFKISEMAETLRIEIELTGVQFSDEVPPTKD